MTSIHHFATALCQCFAFSSKAFKESFLPMSFVYSMQRHERLRFTQSIVDTLSEENETSLRLKQYGDIVAIDSDDLDSTVIPIRRPSYCPFASRNQIHRVHIREAPTPTGRVHIPVASACLLSSPCSGGLLLTQRPLHMRSYPGLWVPPGGHNEPGESVEQTALRELCEELGFGSIAPSEWLSRVPDAVKPLCAWEAAYPALQTPSSHHLVLYYVVQWPTWLYPHNQMDQKNTDDSTFDPPRPTLCLPPDEVHAAVWLPRSVLSVLSQDWVAFDAFWNEKLRAPTNQAHPVSAPPSNTTVNQLTVPVWYWVCNAKRWERKPVNQLICSVTTPETYSTEQSQPSGNSGTMLNPISAGTLYAVTKWLSMHNDS